MFIKKLIAVASAKAAAIPLSILVTVVAARVLGVSGFSDFSLVLAISSILSVPVSGGLSQLLTREVALARISQNFSVCKGLVFSGLIWVIVATTAVLSCYWIALHWASDGVLLRPFFWLTLLIVLLLNLNTGMSGVFRGVKKPGFVVVNDEVFRPLLFLFLVLIGLIAAPHIESIDLLAIYASAMAATFFVYLLFLVFDARSFFKGKGKAEYELKKWGKSMVPFAVIGAVYTLGSNLGIVITGFLGDQDDVAGLRVAERAAQLISMPLVVTNMVVAPIFAEKWKKGEHDDLQSLIATSSWAGFSVSLFFAIFLIAFDDMIIGAAFGQEYAELSHVPLMILVGGQLCNVAFGSVGLLLMMTGHEKLSLVGQSAGLVVNVAVALLLVPGYGAEGAAFGIALGLVAWNVVLGLMIKKHLVLNPGIFSILRKY